MRATPQGVPVAHFSLATTETWKDKVSNERKERTEWHKVVAFNKLATFVGNYIVKGRLILVEGRIQSRDWTDKNNQKRTTVEIRADQILFMESKAKTVVGGSEDGEVEAPPEDVAGGPGEDDVPF
jgi:single-strand DNA-binding protein